MGQTSPYYFYGIDFSHVKVYGAHEKPEDFAKAMGGINGLFIYESGKYNVSRLFKQKYVINVEHMIAYNKNADFTDIMANSPSIPLIDMSAIIDAYELPNQTGTGAVFVARMLDKDGGRGVFDIVVFDIESRKILRTATVEGEPGGYGLRNYWANSIAEILDNTRLY